MVLFQVLHVCVTSTGEEVCYLNCDRIVRESPTLVQSLPVGSLDAKTKKLSLDNREVRSKCCLVGKVCVYVMHM